MVLTVEKLTEMLYVDFLRSNNSGTTLEMLAKWIRSVQVGKHQESDLSIHHYLSDQKEINIEELKR